MIFKTRGLVIKKRDLVEADRLLTIYSQQFGKIMVKAKAVKKSQSKLKGHLELFVLSDLMIAQGKNLDLVVNAETISDFRKIKSNWLPLTAAYYFSELLDKLIAGPEKDEQIWQLAIHSFKKLDSQPQEIEKLINFFEYQLLKYLGHDLSASQHQPLAYISQVLGERINSKRYLNMLKC